jgi:hypothetical protein
MRRQVRPPPWPRGALRGARHWPQSRDGCGVSCQGGQSRKDTSRIAAYRIRKQTAELSSATAAAANPSSLASALPGVHAGPAR